MNLTTFDQFVDLAQRGTFVPVCKEIMADLLTPVSAFLKVAEHADYAFLLESVEGGEHVGRYSFLRHGPALLFLPPGGRGGGGAGAAILFSRKGRFFDSARAGGRKKDQAGGRRIKNGSLPRNE